MSSDVWLEAAHAIGRRLAAEAIWHEGACSWVGAALELVNPARPEYRPVGPLLYDGTAGIALFLAQLAADGEHPVRRTAVGAARHALRRVGSVRPGFHAGSLGLAWAVARTGGLLEEEELRTAAARVAVPGATHQHDLVSGTAGTVVALLGLAAELGTPEPIASARELGEVLLGRPSSRRDLCGVAHGAAGIGWALLELAAATGDDRFADAAIAAFAYERSRFDARRGHWPDLRRPAVAPVGAMRGTWCYGEAGILLSRLRARALLGPGPHGSDADIALQVVREQCAAELDYAFEDFSLCHGLGGVAVALLAAGERAGAEALASEALVRHGAVGDWPCGAYGPTPGLMRGLAGIGWLYLSLARSETPCPLDLPRAVDD